MSSMPYIFVNQTKLRIRLLTSLDLTDATSARIEYKKPSGTQGAWTASFESPRIGGAIYYDIVAAVPPAAEQIDEAGVWSFWGDITFSDGRSLPTTAIMVMAYLEGTLISPV